MKYPEGASRPGLTMLGFLPQHYGDAMDQELISYLDARFQAIDARFEAIETRFQTFEGRFKAMEDRIEALETTIRYTDIKVEALRSDIRLVAEGVAAVNEKLDAFRVEVAREFEQVKAENRSSYAQLERRVTRLEQRAQL
jgi:chromosome segregation ATPase